ncbi:ATP-binding SpoIIE family protein phosphatase [Pseudonocardia dioxanivorans]|uniref:Response regulator receiver modulated serine phosphatase n=1 Tax=Pseudonocardia dioxanivorans (strain ATCC 55486 / DSM 44775 / JCM 13855 / CB1190) TaxID=675635 RepID=F4CSR8_PSEUX|nr:SpoIIE family protein phosphatase [Pseudonocardia dioxanivorans]AEA24521.1 response regulator receiver modulated serine phosphatase [Pseudonocardia dioxanivorans CB1190]
MPATSATGVPAVTSPRHVRVLLVEDDAGDALLVSELFADIGEIHDVLHVHTLAEALAGLDGVDCVLLDMHLPDAAGLDGLTRLLAVDGHPAIVVLTGDVDETRGRAAVAAGAEDYLIKGRVDGRLLTRAVQYAVERRHAERLARQLHEARVHERENRRLARGLLPTALLQDHKVDVTTRYRAGRQQLLLGGDFYDTIETDDGTLHAIIGDVSGHGPDEAAIGVSLRIAWRTLILAGVPAAHTLPVLDRVLVTERHDHTLFTTVATVSVSADRRRADLHLAGHPPPLLIEGTTARPLPDHALGVPLGVQLGTTWAPVEVALPPAWSLLLYTDGLIESRDHDGEVLWVDGLVDVMGDVLATTGPAGGSGSDAVLDALLQAVDARTPFGNDDRAVALLSAAPSAAGTGFDGLPGSRPGHPDLVSGRTRTERDGPERRRMRHRYEPVPEACAELRRDMRAFLTAWHVDEETAEDALLVASELASNAVDHAHTPFSLTATLTPGNLRVEITDGSSAEPRLQPFDMRATRGRGLQMVQNLTSTWSFRRHDAGKTVVADLAVGAMDLHA